MADQKNIYWDSCTWLSLINGEPGRVDNCEHIIEQARKGEVRIWISSLTLAEVFKKKCDAGNRSLSEEKDVEFEKFMEQDFVVEVQVDHSIATIARRLLRKHPELKQPNDAIHLATAAINNVDEFHTFDRDNLLVLNAKIKRRDGKELVICEPPPPPPVQQIPLFSPPRTTEPSKDN